MLTAQSGDKLGHNRYVQSTYLYVSYVCALVAASKYSYAMWSSWIIEAQYTGKRVVGWARRQTRQLGLYGLQRRRYNKADDYNDTNHLYFRFTNIKFADFM